MIPFDGHDFVKVTLDVVGGKRPTIPSMCPEELRTMIQSCWQENAKQRPSMDDIVSFLNAQLDDSNV